MKKLLFLILHIHMLAGFASLDDAKKYAQRKNEYPPFSNKNISLDPDYTQWYITNTPTFLQSLFSVFTRKQEWSAQVFKELLPEVLKFRENEGYMHPHSLVLKPLPGTRFIVLGPVFGAFHSLVRIISELERRKLITQDFKLTKENYYLVVDGDLIDGSPYILETLTLMCAIMRANPHSVIYLSGVHENAEYWQSYGLKTELNIRIEDKRFEDYVARFFATLPRSLLLVDTINTKNVIRIGNLPAEIGEFNEASCSKIFKKVQPGKMKVCLLEKSQGELALKAAINAENRLVSYSKHPGLVLQPSETGVISWSVFSAPNKVYRDYFGFMFDSFIILKIGQSFAQSTLKLFNQDIREQAGFKKSAIYEVTTGKAITPQLLMEQGSPECERTSAIIKKTATVEKKAPIVIGCVLDLSKGASNQGRQVKIGISLCINDQNQKGGINGRPIEIVFMDDEYSPEKARQNVEQFIKKYKSTIFLCNLGSPTLQAYMDMVKAGSIFLFFPVTGAPLFRKPDMKGVVHWRTSYSNEAKGLTSFMIDKHRIRDFAFLYQNDSYGMGALEGAREVLAKEKINNALEVSYERNTTSFKAAVEKVKAGSVRAIGFFSTSVAATEFIRQAGVEFFIGKKLFALSDLAEESFKNFAHQKGLDLVVAQFSPNPAISSIDLVKEYRNALHAQGRTKVDVFMLEGFISTSLMIDILGKTNNNFAHKDILKVIEGIKNYNYKGFNLSFNPQTRELADLLWLDTGQPEWIELKMGSS